jgi:penicillin-binding protein 2
LQLAQMVSIIANRGKSFRPRLVSAVRDIDGRVTKVPPLAGKPVPEISADKWEIVHQGMIGATTRGTAAALSKGATYTIAGKTGTAQVFSVSQSEKVSQKIENERLRDHSWFIAYAPAENPKVAICVLVENGGFGSSVAAPIAKRVMDAYLRLDSGAPKTL